MNGDTQNKNLVQGVTVEYKKSAASRTVGVHMLTLSEMCSVSSRERQHRY